MSAKHAVLGLVIEQPSYAYKIASGVRRQLRFADLADSYPYWALEKLETEGLVRRVDERGEPIGNGGAGRRAIYEATPKGVASFEEWLLSTAAEPSLRDDLHFRIALCRPRDALRMIELVHGQELVCLGRVQDLKRASEADTAETSEWDKMLRVVSRDAELGFWNARIEWLQGVRERLEGLPAEHGASHDKPGTGATCDSHAASVLKDSGLTSPRRPARAALSLSQMERSGDEPERREERSTR